MKMANTIDAPSWSPSPTSFPVSLIIFTNNTWLSDKNLLCQEWSHPLQYGLNVTDCVALGRKSWLVLFTPNSLCLLFFSGWNFKKLSFLGYTEACYRIYRDAYVEKSTLRPLFHRWLRGWAKPETNLHTAQWGNCWLKLLRLTVKLKNAKLIPLKIIICRITYSIWRSRFKMRNGRSPRGRGPILVRGCEG